MPDEDEDCPSGVAPRTDFELFDGWRQGNMNDGNELFQRHFGAIRRFFCNTVDHDEVEELVQRTFMRCVEGRDRFQQRSSFRTFLFAIAHNVLREHYRSKHRSSTIDLETQSVVDLGAGPSSVLARHREQRALLEALRRIPLELQVVLELYYWERLTGPRLGEVLGVPEDTARSRVRRAKQLLKNALAQIEAAPGVLQSTMEDLEGWADRIRAYLHEVDGGDANPDPDGAPTP